MTLTLDIEPALRSARIREAAALAAGDVVSPLFLSGIAGFDPATLSLTLHRDASMARKVAEVQAGSFSPVPGHPSLARAELRLDAVEMEDWFLAAAGGESSSADMSDDAAEDAVRADGWLVVADASRTWAACRIPVVLRDFVGRGTLSGDSVSAVAAAAALAAVEGALSGKADLVGGVVPSSQLPEGPAPSVVSAASLAEFPAEGAAGTLYVDTGARRIYVWDGTSYVEASPSAVTSVNGATGDVSVPPQVQADWSEDSESSPSFVRNKPDLSVLSGPVADWNETDAGSPRHIANKPDLGALARAAQADWTEESEGSPAYIAHKPSAEELQADWNESDSSKPSYVQGKPTAAQLQADWAETDPTSPKFVDHKPDGTAWQADWLEESTGSPNHIRNRPSAVDLQADWEESDSTKPSYVRNRPAAADMQADWAESDTGSPGYVRNRPSAFDRQADWAETDSSKPSYVRNKPAAGATIAEVERAVAAAVAGKQDALGADALAAVSSGITADKVRYFERIAAFALGGGSAGYPFVALAPEVTCSGWSFLPSFAAPGETGWAFAAPVRDGGRWLPVPWEAALDPEGSWDGAESGDSADADVSVAFPRSLGSVGVWRISGFVPATDSFPASVSLLYTGNQSAGTVPARVVSREVGGETVWYCVAARQSAAAKTFTDGFRSLAEIEAAADAQALVAAWDVPADSEDSLEPDFSGISRVAWTVSARGAAEDVLTVPVFSCAAYAPGARPVRVVPGALPEGVSGIQRDMFLVLDCEGLASVPDVAWDSAFDVFDGDAAPVAGEANIYRLTEYAEGRFSVRRAGAVQADWSESDSTDPAFVRNKPTIPAPVDISGKLDGAAAYEAWESGIPYPAGAVVSHNGRLWFCLESNTPDEPSVESSDWEMTTIASLKQNALSVAQLAAVNSGATAAKVATWDGYAAQIAQKANASDVATALAQKANASDLPYAMVTAGEWEFSGTGIPSDLTAEWDSTQNGWVPKSNGSDYGAPTGTQDATTLSWDGNDNSSGYPLTAIRAYALLDRAVNRVEVTGATTLTLPSLVNAGKSRDFYLKMTVTGSQSVSFSPSAGITYTGLGNPAKTYSAGTYVLRFTETSANEFCVTDMLAPMPDATKADKAVPSATGNLASLTAQGNLADSGAKPSDFAAKSDLPYALVEPGEWEFSGSGVDSGREYKMSFNSEQSEWTLNESTSDSEMPWIGIGTVSGTGAELSVEFDDVSITATRASLPGHLLDRAGNRVVVSGDTTLTLPSAITGHLRDFLVRLEISGSTVPTITFSPDGNESVTYETDGDEFPVPDEAGDWLYSFTESCVAHTFAVSLKKVNEVAAPQAQGGS